MHNRGTARVNQDRSQNPYLSYYRIMSSSGNNQPSNKTPILHIDAATLQAAVAAVVTTFLTHINSGNANKTEKGVDNPDRVNDPRNQQIVTVATAQNKSSEFKKRKRQAKVERK